MKNLNRRNFLELTTITLASTFVPACSQQTAPTAITAAKSQSKALANSPNVLIVILDTTRIDHIGCYGYAKNTSPILDEIASQGRRFTSAYSCAPWTVPSHASMFTGLYALAHGATQENLSLNKKFDTLAQNFAQNGYDTFGLAENAMLLKSRGFARGFQNYTECFRLKDKKTALMPTLDLFKKQVKDRDKDKPFFGFINIIAPHAPYAAPDTFRENFISPDDSRMPNNDWKNFYLSGGKVDDKKLRQLTNEYDAEIKFADHTLGEIIDTLEAANCLDDTLLIITSDHGENIGDHGHMDHVFCLYQTLIHIPLIIRYPRLIHPETISNIPVQLHDLFPTALYCSNLDFSNDIHGINILKDKNDVNRPIFTEYFFPKQAINSFPKEVREHANLKKFKRRIKSIILGNKKFIWGSDKVFELYDLDNDPSETTNLAANATEEIESLTKVLDKIVAKYQGDSIPPENESPLENERLDDETRQEMETLGYL